jgi:HD-GYP domain-containing protein (c-di-GMP phosphodiesterase class II)
MLGQGFPRKVTKEKIHPMAKIVSVANEFCNYALKDPNNPGMSARKAYHLLQSYKEDQLDPTAVKALGELIKKE